MQTTGGGSSSSSSKPCKTTTTIMPATSTPVYFFCLLAFASACYIQNCPRGGKRAYPDTEIRQCIPCGPGNKGNCFGPSICCGEELGCYFGTSETLRCLEENYLPSPCETGGRPCGAGGRCAASGICCNDESCTADAACVDENGERSRGSSEKNLTVMDSSTGDLLLKLMHMANANRQQQQGKPQFY